MITITSPRSMCEIIILLVLLTFGPSLYAGFRTEPRVISESKIGVPARVYTADMDGDGDLDVLLSSFFDCTLSWYANDGKGRFGVPKMIAKKIDGPTRAYPADLDGDGDLDILFGSNQYMEKDSDRVAWHANDGTGQFGAQQVISRKAAGVQCVYAADLDGDGDLDALSASCRDDKIAWYANDGKGRFGSPQMISTEVDGAGYVHAADLDGDGDLDVLSAAWGDEVAWFANDGTGRFGAKQVITTATDTPMRVDAADLDGDGDLDVLSASWRDDKVAWYANNGTGQFGSQQIISTIAWGAHNVYTVDLDGDGDLDVLSGSHDWREDSSSGSKTAWYANDGMGNFGPEQIIFEGGGYTDTVCVADLNGDGDPDVVSVGSKLLWHENE